MTSTELAASFENNTEDLFPYESFQPDGKLGKTACRISKPVRMSPNGYKHRTSGYATTCKVFGHAVKNTIEARSLVRYHNLPARIGINDYSDKMNLHQLYIDHSLSLLRKKGVLTQRYAAGVSGDINNLHNGFALYAIPEYQWNLPKWSISFNLPFRWTAFPERKSRIRRLILIYPSFIS